MQPFYLKLRIEFIHPYIKKRTMKKLLLLIVCSITILANAQNTVNITPQQYELLKQSGQLDLTKHYVFIGTVNDLKKIKPSVKAISNRTPSSICSCLIPLDTTFSVVPFNIGTAPEYRNDDGSTNAIALPFSFNLYGNTYNSVYINNNGNISFLAPYMTFTANPFPDSAYNMIAPFWGDVDTRDSASGLVYYKITATSMIVKWENVGYFNVHSDLLNSFQLIITDGTDPLLPAGTNVSFCYGDMQWTTGDASSGINGFGGVAATVGVNQGNGIDYFQVGTFDSAGIAFDGPYNATDKVDWLDNQGMYFNTAVVGNIPPVIINNNICDTIDVYTGDTTRTPHYNFAQFTLGASTPEIGQVVSASVTCSNPAAFTFTESMNTPTYKQFDCTFSATGLAPGLYYVTILASDNGTPAQQTSRTIVVRNNYDVNAIAGITERLESLSISVYPNPAVDNIIVKHGFNPHSNPVLTLTDVLGNTVLKTTLNNQEQTIDILNLTKGIYFATITGPEGKSKAIKIIRK